MKFIPVTIASVLAESYRARATSGERFLSSFPKDPGTAELGVQLVRLLLEDAKYQVALGAHPRPIQKTYQALIYQIERKLKADPEGTVIDLRLVIAHWAKAK